MMATWDNAVYTTRGINLLAKLQAGATLQITRAVGGDGQTSADALTALTEITAKQTLTLSDAIYKGGGQVLLPVTLYNRDLTAGYVLRQIGIYATDPDDGEILMLVAQSDTPDTIPAASDSPDYVANFSFRIALGNAGQISISYSLTDMATKADYDNVMTQLGNKADKSLIAQPGGLATLNGSGKLAQMPTAADVGAVPTGRTVNGKALSSNISLTAADVEAIKLRWSTLINETTATSNKYNFDDYITPGDVVSICNYAGAQSVANIPDAVPGKLYVLPLRTDDQARNDLMQEYHTVTGNVWCRHKFYYSGNAWGAWSSSPTRYNTLYEGLCNTNNTTLTLAYPITDFRLLIVTGTTNQYGTHWAQSNILPVGENPGEGGRKFVVGISDRGTARLLLSGSASLTFKFVEANKILTISGFGAEATLTGVFGIK